MLRLFLKNLLFTLVVPAGVGVYWPLALMWERGRGFAWPVWGLRPALALVPLGLGAAIYLGCLWDFASFGRATPFPLDAPRRLVVRGLYRYVRNPMYVGVLSLVLGWATFFGAPKLLLYATAVALVFQLFIVGVEEPSLRRQFGAEYADYCRRVGRWWPRRLQS